MLRHWYIDCILYIAGNLEKIMYFYCFEHVFLLYVYVSSLHQLALFDYPD